MKAVDNVTSYFIMVVYNEEFFLFREVKNVWKSFNLIALIAMGHLTSVRDASYSYIIKIFWKTWKGKMIKIMLKRRKESGTYLEDSSADEGRSAG